MICPNCRSITESIFRCGHCDWVFGMECPYCATEIAEEYFVDEMKRSVMNVIINKNGTDTSNR